MKNKVPESENESKNKIIKEIYEKYANDILIYLYRCTNNYHLACDLLQDTFLNFIRIFSDKELIEESKAKIYLFQTAKNLFINNYRKIKKQVILSYNDEIETKQNTSTQINPEEQVLNIEDQKIKEKMLNELLEHLDQEEKTIIILRYNLDLKLEEIAEIMNKSISSISRRIQKIQKKLLKIAQNKKFL
ncbi:MAG: DNA-directed RNA polymerase sigma-70 factor [Leptospiraceae bacterium]|nr:MAG: DNA-directed RNA polymerase sigma-70 factor [Leptospiraceae bacterium]